MISKAGEQCIEPARQRRGTAAWDLLADGPLAVVGGTRSGRTTLVRALPSTAIARMHQLLVSEMSSPQRG